MTNDEFNKTGNWRQTFNLILINGETIRVSTVAEVNNLRRKNKVDRCQAKLVKEMIQEHETTNKALSIANAPWT
jgi:hypothetical protein